MKDIVIRCLGCGATRAQGGIADITEDEVYNQALHNPGCIIARPGMLTLVHRDEREDKIIYSIVVFPQHNEETQVV